MVLIYFGLSLLYLLHCVQSFEISRNPVSNYINRANVNSALCSSILPPTYLSLQKKVKYNKSPLSNSRLTAVTGSIDPKNVNKILIGKNFAAFNRLVNRSAWVSWWIQIILTVISTVILTFANTVRQGSSKQTLWASGFAFSGLGVLLSFLNCFLTWNITTVSRRISARKIEESKIIPTLRRYFRISVIICLVGMLITLLGAEQIVGTLAAKVLSSQGLQPLIGVVNQSNMLQALDIFLVQSNTNTLLAHYAPLVCFLWLQMQLPSVLTDSNLPNKSSTNEASAAIVDSTISLDEAE